MRLRLRQRLRPPATAVVIPVPEAASVVGAGEPGMPPHVTLLWPFARRLRAGHRLGLDAIAATHPPFTFTLARVGTFPGVVYLAPEPAPPFVDLVEAITGTWPRHQAYGGAYAEVIPHLTVPNGDPAQLEAMLPIRCHAREILVLSPADGGWREIYRVPLAASTSA
ncbi:MAG: hypothetical protein QOD07_1522 [Frankiaceae bacterium]|jgi:hypothetical protein|nr:hypothetical protein [Frankiaceae bacterium]